MLHRVAPTATTMDALLRAPEKKQLESLLADILASITTTTTSSDIRVVAAKLRDVLKIN